LFFLLTGRVPFPGRNGTDKLLRHQTETPPPVDRLRPEVPPRVAAVVARLMAKRPGDRYPTPAALAAVAGGKGRPVAGR
jgi:serine/threonine-protein kinase